MVPPWFVHGLSIDLGVFDGGTMEKPWRNHGRTMKEGYRKPLFQRHGIDI
ncbi:MAG: hypothetical protein ACPGSG_01065 [Prolixibacteraceae bacterium]